MVRVSARGLPDCKGPFQVLFLIRGAHGLLLLGRTSSLRGLPGFTVAYRGLRGSREGCLRLSGLTVPYAAFYVSKNTRHYPG